MNKKTLTIVYFFVLFFSLIYSYRELFYTFYQQDEWLTLGSLYGGGVFQFFNWVPFAYHIGGASRFFGTLINNLFFYFFEYDLRPFAAFGLGIHCLNIILWYRISYLVTKNRVASIISSSFFGISFVASQAITWFACIFTTLPSATFVFLSLLGMLTYLKTRKVKTLVLAQIYVIIAYIFKESAIFMFFLLPILLIYKDKELDIRNIISKFGVIFIYAIYVIILRVYSISHLGSAAGAFVSGSGNMWLKMILHVVLYPLFSLPQMFVPPKIMFSLAQQFQEAYYGNITGFVSTQLGVETIVSDYLSFLMSILFICLLIFYWKFAKPIRYWLIFGCCFAIMSFMPFTVLDKGNAYLDSRYFYLGVAGGGLILASFMYGIFGFFKTKYQFIKKIVFIVMCIGFIFYLYKNCIFIQRDIRQYVYISNERKDILYTIKKMIPNLPAKPVFYVTGTHYGYYGNPEVKIPFQQGFGYTLMVWYKDSDKIPKELLNDLYLWGLKDQGYKEVSGKGFGYFSDIDQLKKLIQSQNIKKEQILGLRYYSDTKALEDITKEVIGELNLE